MELLKYTAEERAKIDADRLKPHCALCLFMKLSPLDVFQDHAAAVLERGMEAVKERAERAKMQILSTTITSNVVPLAEGPYIAVMLLCQWVEIEKLETMQRRAALGGIPPGRG